MKVEISKTNWNKLMSLIDKSVDIIRAGSPNNKDYNTARMLAMTKKAIIRNCKIDGEG